MTTAHQTNYDTSSTGVDCEISIYHDTESARWLFDENFDRITDTNSQRDYFFFTNAGSYCQPHGVRDCYDLSQAPRREIRQFVIDQCRNEWYTPRDIIRDNRDTYGGDWREHAGDVMADMSLTACIRDGFPRIGRLLYDVASVAGFCQRDLAEVLYPTNAIHGNAGEVFSQLIYDVPVYATLGVDGKEYDLTGSMPDQYDYDREVMAETIRELDIPEPAKLWAVNSLPEWPDYI